MGIDPSTLISSSLVQLVIFVIFLVGITIKITRVISRLEKTEEKLQETLKKVVNLNLFSSMVNAHNSLSKEFKSYKNKTDPVFSVLKEELTEEQLKKSDLRYRNNPYTFLKLDKDITGEVILLTTEFKECSK